MKKEYLFYFTDEKTVMQLMVKESFSKKAKMTFLRNAEKNISHMPSNMKKDYEKVVNLLRGQRIVYFSCNFHPLSIIDDKDIVYYCHYMENPDTPIEFSMRKLKLGSHKTRTAFQDLIVRSLYLIAYMHWYFARMDYIRCPDCNHEQVKNNDKNLITCSNSDCLSHMQSRWFRSHMVGRIIGKGKELELPV